MSGGIRLCKKIQVGVDFVATRGPRRYLENSESLKTLILGLETRNLALNNLKFVQELI